MRDAKGERRLLRFPKAHYNNIRSFHRKGNE